VVVIWFKGKKVRFSFHKMFLLACNFFSFLSLIYRGSQVEVLLEL
jgi:hypothetical protein